MKALLAYHSLIRSMTPERLAVIAEFVALTDRFSETFLRAGQSQEVARGRGLAVVRALLAVESPKETVENGECKVSSVFEPA